MAAKLKLVWKMAPGDVFERKLRLKFCDAGPKKEQASMTKWMQTVITTYDVKADLTPTRSTVFSISRNPLRARASCFPVEESICR